MSLTRHELLSGLRIGSTDYSSSKLLVLASTQIKEAPLEWHIMSFSLPSAVDDHVLLAPDCVSLSVSS